jgi:prepilin-type N-terminal cleavage/methylation domain-containing protein
MSARRPWTAVKDGERGFSLIEVVIAIGVLAGVLLSICSMFILGGRQVKGGKTMTEATALAHDLMETFDKLSYTGLYTTFGAVAADTTKSVTTTGATNPITPWRTEVERKLDNGVATTRLDPVGGTNFGNAIGIKMTVTLSWNELGRPQSVTLSTIRF